MTALEALTPQHRIDPESFRSLHPYALFTVTGHYYGLRFSNLSCAIATAARLKTYECGAIDVLIMDERTRETWDCYGRPVLRDKPCFTSS